MNIIDMNTCLYYVSMFCSLSICIAAIIAWWRFNNIHQAFRPFIYCIWLGTVNEIISYSITPFVHSTMINGNIYVLLESFLLVWQFRKWGLFERYRKIFTCLLMLLGMVWIAENFIISSITVLSSYLMPSEHAQRRDLFLQTYFGQAGTPDSQMPIQPV